MPADYFNWTCNMSVAFCVARFGITCPDSFEGSEIYLTRFLLSLDMRNVIILTLF